MNICILIDSSLDAPGGTVQSLLNQRAVLRAAGHTVYIVCLGRKVLKDPEIYYARPYVALINDDVNFAYLLNNPITYGRILRFMQSRDIDVLHIQSELTMSDVGIRIARKLNVPVIMTVHNYFWPATGPLQRVGGVLIELQAIVLLRTKLQLSCFGDNRLERAIRGLTEFACRRVDRIVAPSSHLKAKLREAGVDTPIDVLPNPYMSTAGVAAPRELAAGGRVAHFVWIGRCAPEKRLLDFVQAIVIVSQTTDVPFRVTIIGEGADLSAARQMVREHNLSNTVTCTGRIDNEAVVRYIDEASFVVLTSYHFDNQPVIISEAVSRYRGVLYCDERITEGVVQAGYLTAGPKSSQIADSMLEIISNPSLAVEYSRRAKKAARQFAGATYVAEFEHIVARAKAAHVL